MGGNFVRARKRYFGELFQGDKHFTFVPPLQQLESLVSRARALKYENATYNFDT